MSAEIVVPALGESVTEATVAKWLKSVGDAVNVNDALVELETDKVTLEVNASAAGTLQDIVADEGENVEIGSILGHITEGAVSVKPAPTPSVKAAPEKTPSKSPVLEGAQPPSSSAPQSPAVRKLLDENKLDPKAIQGTGKEGRLLKGDVLEALKGPAPGSAVQNHASRTERVKMTRLRQRIATRLKEAQNTAAILTTFNEIDMTNLLALRKSYKEAFEKKHGVKLGFMSFFAKACIEALKEIPEVNAEIHEDEIIYKNYYDVGVAVGTPQGLVVPVVRDADQLSIAGIEKAIGELAKKAREGKLSMEDLTGGTFTISNGGVYGSLMSTPILNPPQSGILGMHKTQERPMVVDGEIKVRPMMYIALSYDHRIIDGREAVTFLVRVKENIEDPQRLLLSV